MQPYRSIDGTRTLNKSPQLGIHLQAVARPSCLVVKTDLIFSSCEPWESSASGWVSMLLNHRGSHRNYVCHRLRIMMQQFPCMSGAQMQLSFRKGT
jgi:hypothetical protein